MSAIFVLHAPGDSRGGAPWRDALVVAGWDGPVLAPDLPGHGLAPPPVGGQHELADPAFAAPRMLADAGLGGERPIVVGVGANGWPAQLLALGGRASGLVIVDGLGGPWHSPQQAVTVARDRLRALADDAPAVVPHTAPGLDPRLAHGPFPHGSRELAMRAARSVAVPTLLLESSRSSTPPADREALRTVWAAPVELRETPDLTPESMAAVVVAWASRAQPATWE